MPDIRTILSHKAKVKSFRPSDLMEATGLQGQMDTVDRVRKNPDYPSILSALAGADAESPPIILTERPDGSLAILAGKKYILAHFDLDKERAKVLIVDDRDSAAVQIFLNRHAQRPQTPNEDEELIWRAYLED